MVVLIADVDPRQSDQSLEMPQHFVMPMREDRHIFSGHPTVEKARLVDGVCFSLHKEPPKTCCPVHFLHAETFLDRILPVSVSSPLVSDVSTLFGLCDSPCLSLFSISFISVNTETYTVHKIRKLLYQIEVRDTNYSLTETTIGLSPLANGAARGHHLMTSGTSDSGSRIGDDMIRKAQMW